MEPERIQFPIEYPIKVVARDESELRLRIEAVFVRHFGPRAPDGVSERRSAQGRFTALTYRPVVEHEGQLRAVHAELVTLDGVMLVL